LKKIDKLGEQIFGLDPIWKCNPPPQLGEKIKVVGKFVEELDFEQDLGGRPDLVLSAHTFEHIENPRDQLEKIVGIAEANAIIIVEVPGFDSLLNNCRFDQVFHQHVQYYSLASFERLIYEVGGEYIDHAFNYGYWGGTMMVAFRKNSKKDKTFSGKFQKRTMQVVEEKIKLFTVQMNNSMKLLETFKNEPICGYGAAQMLPTVAYHMNSDFSFMKCVYDDNTDRNGLMYPYMPIVIEKPKENQTLEGVNVLVTALDSARPIVKRISQLKAKRVILPLNVF